jgi:phosphate:Na+ symporter
MDVLFFMLFILLIISFLIGIKWLRTGLFMLSGKAMERWMKKITSTPLKGMAVGILMTALMQSSAAVMVITIGLVAARVLAFPETIGIILGTNIGTTFTLEFLSFDLSRIAIPFFIAGVCLLLFTANRLKSIGFILTGFAIIVGSMRALERLAVPLTRLGFIQHLLQLVSHHTVLSFLLGIGLTACIQSSTVMTGIAMSFLSAGIFPLETGIAIMLGANIGTCITALLASFGGGEEARLTAYAHVWLNVAGALVCMPLIHYLAFFCKSLTVHPEAQLAHASVMFNLISSLLVLPFASKFGNFIVKLHGKKT